MDFVKIEHGLILRVASDGSREVLQEYKDADKLDLDSSLHEMFADILANCEYEWISPEEIGALTDAPILGIRDEDGDVLEAYGFMDYAVRSLLGDLFERGEAILRKG